MQLDAISTLHREKKNQKSLEDMTEHLFNHIKSKFIVYFSSLFFCVYVKLDKSDFI